MRTSEDNPHDWFLLAADRLRITDLAYQHEGVTFSGVELLQEAVERYLKGYLIAQRWQLERTHDLGRLIEAAGHFDARFLGYAVLAEKLTDRYWDQHYPGADLSDFGSDWVVGQFDCGTRILRVIHGRDARATLQTDPLPQITKACGNKQEN